MTIRSQLDLIQNQIQIARQDDLDRERLKQPRLSADQAYDNVLYLIRANRELEIALQRCDKAGL